MMRVPVSLLVGDLPLDTFERVDAALALAAEARAEAAQAETGRTLLIEACREALSFEASRAQEGL